jgi:hypothetical protein
MSLKLVRKLTKIFQLFPSLRLTFIDFTVFTIDDATRVIIFLVSSRGELDVFETSTQAYKNIPTLSFPQVDFYRFLQFIQLTMQIVLILS